MIERWQSLVCLRQVCEVDSEAVTVWTLETRWKQELMQRWWLGDWLLLGSWSDLLIPLPVTFRETPSISELLIRRACQDPWKPPWWPDPYPDRKWPNFFLCHRAVRIEFSKIWQKARSDFPDKNLADQINPYPDLDKKCGKSEVRTQEVCWQ